MRCRSCSAVISREKMPTGRLFLKQMFSAMLRASAVFPIAGRAARIIRLEGAESIDHFVEIDEMGRNAGDARFFGSALLEIFLVSLGAL